MKELLIKIQELQADVIGFENYSLSVNVSSEYIFANLHSKVQSLNIVASLGFVHKDYIEDSKEAVETFVNDVTSELLNNNN